MKRRIVFATGNENKMKEIEKATQEAEKEISSTQKALKKKED